MKMKNFVCSVLLGFLACSAASASVTYNWVYSSGNGGTPTNAQMTLVFTDQAYQAGTAHFDFTNCHTLEDTCSFPDAPLTSFRVRQGQNFNINLSPSLLANGVGLSIDVTLGDTLSGTIAGHNFNDGVAVSGSRLMTITRFGSDGLDESGGCSYFNQGGCNGATGYFVREGAVFSEVPEPISLSLVLAGLFAVFIARRYRVA